MKPAKQSWILAGGLLSALAASLCCIGPLVAVALGLGSFAAAGWFTASRPIFLGVTVGLLAVAWFLAIRARRMQCAADASCATLPAKRWPLVLLSFCTLAVAGVALFPEAARAVADRASPASTSAVGGTVLRVRIPSMDCAACAIGIEGTLQRVAGVRFAAVRYATKEAEIAYDPSIVSQAALIARIDGTGFKAELIK
jgi:mercuric ion transport protein